MLQEHGREFTYREYTKQPLSLDELRELMGQLGTSPREVLRTRDAKALDLEPGTMDDEQLLVAMSKHPRLLQRPIVREHGKAILGRPAERVLEL